jgi:hypothetical protein
MEKLEQANALKAAILAEKKELTLLEAAIKNHAEKGKPFIMLLPTVPEQTSNHIKLRPTLMGRATDQIIDSYVNQLRASIQEMETQLANLFK